MPLDLDALRTVVANQGSKVLIKQVRPLAKLDFEAKKEKFLDAFDADPVSEEISAGPEAYSQVPELAAAGGNLFSLLGFYADQKPIESLREYLNDNIILYHTHAGYRQGDQIIFETDILAPSEDEIDGVIATSDKLKWTSRSWTSLLARGITGLPKYLFDLTRDFSHIPSLSGPAIQVKNDLRNAEMPEIHYIKRLLSVLRRIMNPRG